MLRQVALLRTITRERMTVVIPTRLSFGTAHRKRLFVSATLCEPLIRERLLHPYEKASLDAAGQWLMCRAGTTPTEVPTNCKVSRLVSEGSTPLHNRYTADIGFVKAIFSTPQTTFGGVLLGS